MSSFTAGEFQTEACHIVNQEGESLDLSGTAVTFRLYEAIDKKFVTGDVTIADGLNLIKNYRFTGQEFIRIAINQREGDCDDNFSDKKFSIDKTFRVFKISTVERRDGTIQSYQFKICDPAKFTSLRTRLSKTLRGSYSDMLGKVMMDHCHVTAKEIDNWEDSVPPNQQFIVPNWTIARFLDFICLNANKGTEAVYRNGMFFYQTLNGGFRFRSIDTMFKEEFPVDFTLLPLSAEDTHDIDINGPGGLNSQIQKIKRPQVFDTLWGTESGAFASSAKVYDPIKKIEEDIIYDMEETFGRSPNHVSGYPMIRTSKMLVNEQERILSTDNMVDAQISPKVNEIGVDLAPNRATDALVLYDYTTNHDFDNSSDITSDPIFKGQSFKTNGILERQALLETLKQNKIEVTIPLRTDISVGTIIKLKIPEPEIYSETSSPTDKVNDHRYLITSLAINGSFFNASGDMNLECVKESFARDISKATPREDSAGPEDVV